VSLQLVALLVNIALTVLKFTVGVMAGSRALLADAFNSAGDVFATFLAWIATTTATRTPSRSAAWWWG
jgi:divalent metal cation (Fe/Co/Zn/Cd) transporter